MVLRGRPPRWGDVLSWSLWRGHHQAVARRCHYTRRGVLVVLMTTVVLAEDPVRQRIDRAICEALSLPEDPMAALRGMLGSEPRFAQIPPSRRVLEQLAEVQHPLF